jgi:hypothetical protein
MIANIYAGRSAWLRYFLQAHAREEGTTGSSLAEWTHLPPHHRNRHVVIRPLNSIIQSFELSLYGARLLVAFGCTSRVKWLGNYGWYSLLAQYLRIWPNDNAE